MFCLSPRSVLFPYTTLFRSRRAGHGGEQLRAVVPRAALGPGARAAQGDPLARQARERRAVQRSEEHTSEIQSRVDLVCRLLIEKKKRSSTCWLLDRDVYCAT